MTVGEAPLIKTGTGVQKHVEVPLIEFADWYGYRDLMMMLHDFITFWPGVFTTLRKGPCGSHEEELF